MHLQNWIKDDLEKKRKEQEAQQALIDHEIAHARTRRLKQKQRHKGKKMIGDAAYDSSSSDESRYRRSDSGDSDRDMPGMAEQSSEDAGPAPLTKDDSDEADAESGTRYEVERATGMEVDDPRW